MPKLTNPTHCYLCGRLLSHQISKDHCPPRALFAKKIRQQYNLDRLITIPAHKDCNTSYMQDEEYFIATMIPFAPGSVAGDAIFKEFIAHSRKDRHKRRLAEKVLREFEPRPSGLYLPLDKVAKRQEGDRIKRIAWKIARGLYFSHFSGSILPESIHVGCTLTPPNQRPPEHFGYVAVDDTHGRYPGVFDYRFKNFEINPVKLNYWEFLLWDRVIITVYSHDPWSCPCIDCTFAVAAMEMRAKEVGMGKEKENPASCGI